MKIYTRVGDTGETGLFAGPRMPKDDPRIEAYGEVDELNAVFGNVRCESLPNDVAELLVAIQNSLFAVGAELATPEPAKQGISVVTDQRVEALEQAIDRFEAELPPLKQFILPGGSRAAAVLHLARTDCRRTERRLVTLHRAEPNVSECLVRYLNRLSDLLLVMARIANFRCGVADEPWSQST